MKINIEIRWVLFLILVVIVSSLKKPVESPCSPTMGLKFYKKGKLVKEINTQNFYISRVARRWTGKYGEWNADSVTVDIK